MGARDRGDVLLELDSAGEPAADMSGGGSGLAANLAVLLDLPRDAVVVWVGPLGGVQRAAFARFFADFRHVPESDRLAAADLEQASAQLVVWDRRLAPGRASLDSTLGAIRDILAADGRLVLFGENRFAAPRLRGRPNRPGRLRGSASRRAYQVSLARHGFHRSEVFLPLPSVFAPEEYASATCGDIWLPGGMPRLSRLAHRLGHLAAVHDGFMFVAPGLGMEKLREVIRARADVAEGDSLDVERFDIRSRGALVILLRASRTLERMVCRVATTTSVDEAVGRNAAWLSRLYEDVRISSWLRARVPRPIATFPLEEGMAYVERLVPGAVVWKLADSAAARRRLTDGMAEFTRRLTAGTARWEEPTTALLDRLFPVAPSHREGPVELARAELRLRASVAQRLRGRRLLVAWAHGDFGWGNTLADPKTLRISGVIDWDGATDTELAGVDLFNMLLHWAELAEGLPPERALTLLATQAPHRCGEEVMAYLEEFGISTGDMRVLMALVALRVVQRALKYPALASESEAKDLRLVAAAERLLA